MRYASYSFRSDMVVCGKPLEAFPEEVVKNEPMFFSASPRFAVAEGGPITRNFFLRVADTLPRFLEDGVFDSRVHMLMPGWFPCIPGYHHDDVPRATPSSQPDYDDPAYRSVHVMALVNGEICPTLFAIGQARMPGLPDDEIIYKRWHEETVAAIQRGELKEVETPSNRLIFFDDRALHTGWRARANGWRWFGRLSRGTHRQVTNEIRRQVQVYLEFPMEGW